MYIKVISQLKLYYENVLKCYYRYNSSCIKFRNKLCVNTMLDHILIRKWFCINFNLYKPKQILTISQLCDEIILRYKVGFLSSYNSLIPLGNWSCHFPGISTPFRPVFQPNSVLTLINTWNNIHYIKFLQFIDGLFAMDWHRLLWEPQFLQPLLWHDFGENWN